MIGYVTLGTNNLEEHAKFYDALFAELGVTRMVETDHFIAWSGINGGAGVALTKPFDGHQASAGNGTMIAFQLKSTAEVDKLHNKAIELGARCEGKAAQRSPGFYAAYFRDHDGNKCNFFYTNPTEFLP